jgi:hypothetical protein
MKIRTLLFALLVVTSGFAQEPAKSQMQCHHIISGAQLAMDEVVIGDKVCRKIQSAPSGDTGTISMSVETAFATPEPLLRAAVTPVRPNSPASVPARPAAPAPVPLSPQKGPPTEGKLRVYVTDRPQTTEIMKTFNQRCPEVAVTNNVAKADFDVTLDHEGGKGYLHRRNKIVVFNRDGDDIFTGSTRELGNSVKDACQAILFSVLKR